LKTEIYAGSVNEPKLVEWECSSLEVEDNAGKSLVPNRRDTDPKAMVSGAAKSPHQSQITQIMIVY